MKRGASTQIWPARNDSGREPQLGLFLKF